MPKDTFVSNLRPCCECGLPIAKIARKCHICGAVQPDYEVPEEATFETEVAVEQSKLAAAAPPAKEPPIEYVSSARAPFRKIAHMLRSSVKFG